MFWCWYCKKTLPPQSRGRPRRYCANACKQRAYRRRRATLVQVMRNTGMGEYVPQRWADYRSPFPRAD